jgi:hypothetical protein
VYFAYVEEARASAPTFGDLFSGWLWRRSLPRFYWIEKLSVISDQPNLAAITYLWPASKYNGIV